MSNKNEPKGFNQAKNKAKDILRDKKKLNDLLNKGVEKSKKDGGKLTYLFDELKALIRMIRAASSGAYKAMSKMSILYAVAGVVYFVNPFDVVPDFILGIGFLDDVTVLGFVISRIKKELDKFKKWEKSPKKEVPMS
jgi:uncharacterized membrane protein YkvA (DUF1232 family)